VIKTEFPIFLPISSLFSNIGTTTAIEEETKTNPIINMVIGSKPRKCPILTPMRKGIAPFIKDNKKRSLSDFLNFPCLVSKPAINIKNVRPKLPRKSVVESVLKIFKTLGPIIIPPTIKATTQGKWNLLRSEEDKRPIRTIMKKAKNGSMID
jgi:hypothetical protein